MSSPFQSGAATWSSAGSNPLDDVRTWAQRVRETVGPPQITAPRRPAYADLTVHYGDGRTMLLRVEHPHLQIDREAEFGDYRGGDLFRRILDDRVRVTVEGRLLDPRQPAPGSAPAPPPTPEPATPAPPTPARSVGDFPDLADLGRS